MYSSISVVKCSLWWDPNSCLFPLFEEVSSPPPPGKPPTANNRWPDSCLLQLALSVLTSPSVGSYFICQNPYVHFCFFFHALRLFHVWLTFLQLTQGWVVINKCILPSFFFKNFIYHILVNFPTHPTLFLQSLSIPSCAALLLRVEPPTRAWTSYLRAHP